MAWPRSAPRVAGRPRPRTVLVIGREPQSLRAISVSGGFGFLHDLLDLAGGDNVFGDVKRESMMVATETILAQPPDVILELHYSDAPSPTRASPRARRVDAAARRFPPSGTAASTCLRRRTGRARAARGADRPAFARALHPDAAVKAGPALASSTGTANAGRSDSLVRLRELDGDRVRDEPFWCASSRKSCTARRLSSV